MIFALFKIRGEGFRRYRLMNLTNNTFAAFDELDEINQLFEWLNSNTYNSIDSILTNDWFSLLSNNIVANDLDELRKIILFLHPEEFI